jgi:hypothetical protein
VPAPDVGVELRVENVRADALVDVFFARVVGIEHFLYAVAVEGFFAVRFCFAIFGAAVHCDTSRKLFQPRVGEAELGWRNEAGSDEMGASKEEQNGGRSGGEHFLPIAGGLRLVALDRSLEWNSDNDEAFIEALNNSAGTVARTPPWHACVADKPSS